MVKRSLLLGILLLAPLQAVAVQPDEILPDAKLEARARNLSAQLRCMVCQNESIDESDAALARDLRLLVRERLRAGDSDDAIRGFLVQRYGDFILLQPPFKATTLLLWTAPFLLLLIGGVTIVLALRRHGTGSDLAAALTEAESKKLEALLDRSKS
jgi:cytochrome c-type biogenesis protein CcmH